MAQQREIQQLQQQTSKFEKEQLWQKKQQKTHPKHYTQAKLNELIELAIKHTLQMNTQMDVNQINQQPETDVKLSQKSD